MTIVDIHCHSFNGGDLPVEGFVKHVALRDKWLLPDWAKARLARRADRMVQREKHGYEAERKILQKLLDASALGLAEPDDADVDLGPPFEQQVAEDLRDLLEEDPETAALLDAESAEAGFVSPSEAEAFLAFARNLASTRVAVARRLIATYPEVNIFTPMLVDMSYGVDDQPMTSVAEQIDLHEMISRLSILGRLSPTDALLLPFVGFDPRRAVEFPAALDLVKDAVLTKGFVGIKMYPPMGFSPIGNDEPRVDDVLNDLYGFCELECVPITVHCNRTQGAKSKLNDKRSDPQRWGEVLRAHRTLHLNLGHFGGNKRSGKVFWPEEISKLAADYHLYADIGCHTDLLDSNGREEYRKVLDQVFTGAGAPMRDRVMYGSDWSMLLQHPGAERYLHDVLTMFAQAEHARFAGGRALDFLGLGAIPNRNGQRILSRIRELGANPNTWLQ